MASKLNIGVACFLSFLALLMGAASVVFDIRKYGAKADCGSDDSQAIAKAWNAACMSTSLSLILIGKGNYLVGPVMFKGPCKAPVTVQVQGNVIAPVDVNKFKLQDGWIVFQNID